MMTRIVLLILGLYHVGNALWMLVAPEDWYAVPAVTDTGPMNPHFITDIALAFLASGVGMMIAARRGVVAATLGLAGSVWPALHGLFHVWEWIGHGLPDDFEKAATEMIGVVLVGVLGLALATMRARKDGVM